MGCYCYQRKVALVDRSFPLYATAKTGHEHFRQKAPLSLVVVSFLFPTYLSLVCPKYDFYMLLYDGLSIPSYSTVTVGQEASRGSTSATRISRLTVDIFKGQPISSEKTCMQIYFIIIRSGHV